MTPPSWVVRRGGGRSYTLSLEATPQGAAGSAACCPHLLDWHAERAMISSEFRQAEHDALHEGPASCAGRRAGSSGRGNLPAPWGVEVRRAFPREVRQEDVSPSAPGSTLRGSLHFRVGATAQSLAPPLKSEPPAERVTPIRWYAPGTAWQKAWSRPEGSGQNSSEWAKSTPLVPTEELTRPPSRRPPRPRRQRYPRLRPRRGRGRKPELFGDRAVSTSPVFSGPS